MNQELNSSDSKQGHYSRTVLNVVDHLGAMIAYWDRDLICRFANKSYLDWFGVSRDSMIDTVRLNELTGKQYEEIRGYIDGVLAGVPQQFERSIHIPGGEVRYAIVNYYPDVVNGSVNGFIAHTVDISTIKRLEFKLLASEQKFKAILENAPDAVLIMKQSGVIHLFNAQTEKLFGFKLTDLIGQSIETIIPGVRHQILSLLLTDASQPSGILLLDDLIEFVGVNHEAHEIPLEIRFSPLHLGEELFIMLSIRDITSRKESERILSESNNRHRIFIQQSPSAIAMLDKDMRYLVTSHRWIEDYKLHGVDIIGQSHYDIFPEIGADWKLILQACLQGAEIHRDEELFKRANGSEQWLTWDVRPWFVSKGEIGGILMFTTDITHIKKRDEEQRRIEAILDNTNDVARIGHWEYDLTSGEVLWSKVTRELLEVDMNYVPNLLNAIQFYKVGESRTTIQAALDAAMRSGTPFDLELEIVQTSGTSIWVRVIGQATCQDGTCMRLFGVIQDINDIVTSREALHTLNEELNTLLEAGYIAIIGTNAQGLITHFSKGAEQLLLYTADELVGKENLLRFHVKEEIEQRKQEISAQLNMPISELDVLVASISTAHSESHIWQYQRKDTTLFTAQLVLTPVRNSQGLLVGYLGVATDISDLKKAEGEMQSLLRTTIDQNNRLQNFTYIVSHNLRSHTTNIQSLLEIFMKQTPDFDDNPFIQQMHQSTLNLSETILNLNEVISIANNKDIVLQPINLLQTLQAALSNVSQLINDAGVNIHINVSPELTLLGQLAYTDSILLNFITNAIKYRSPDRLPTITCTASEQQDTIVLAIKDNGLGIDLAKCSSRLFGMYKTFHRNKDAKGIGLFISKNQIEAMGGKIEVESQVDAGSTFSLYFKKATAPA